MVRLVNDKDLERVLTESRGYLVICFFDYGSVPCEHFTPEFKATAESLGDKAWFARINVTENPGIVAELGVEAVPTTLMFKDGDEVKRLEGPYSHVALHGRLLEMISPKSKRKRGAS